MSTTTPSPLHPGAGQTSSPFLTFAPFRSTHDAFAVLATKLKPPAASENWVDRKPLISKLEAGAARRLTLISAPAGYGKSCLATQWILQFKRKIAWLSLDEHENGLDQFMVYVVAALQTQVPGFASRFEQLLRGLRFPPPQFLADQLALCFQRSDVSLTLVLDDYHKITSREVHAFVKRLIEYLPESLRLVVLTREDPPWLRKRWFVEGWVNALRADDLSFSLQETQLFFAQVGTRIELEAAKELHSRLEGWVAGIQLAYLAGLAGGADLGKRLRAAKGEEGFFRDFLVEEVVSQQPPDVQEFLAVSAHLDRFCASLCDAVLDRNKGESYSAEMIRHVRGANLFVVPLDTEDVWFRYHHLFADVLRSLPRLNPPKEMLSQTYRRAAAWSGEHGLLSESLEYFLKAGDIESAAASLENNLHGIIEFDFSRRTLQRYLNLFPPEAEKTRPILLVARAFCSMVRTDATTTKPLLNRVETLLRQRSAKIPADLLKAVQADVAAVRSFVCFWAGEARGAARFGLGALRLAPKESYFTRTVASMYAAFGEYMTGRKKAALELLANEIRADCEEGSRRMGQLLMAQMAIHTWGGDFAELEDVYHEMERIYNAGLTDAFFYGYGIYLRGRAAFEKNDLVSAESYFSKLETVRYQVAPRIYHDSQLGLSLIASSRGNFALCHKFIATAQNWAMEAQDPSLMLASDSFSARLSMLSGKTPAEIRGKDHAIGWVQPWLELPYLTKLECGVHKASSGLRSRILPAIGKSLAQAQQHHNIPQVIQLLTVRALALWRIGLRKEALQSLKQALRLGQMRGFVRTFVDRPSLVRDLLQALLDKRPDDDFVRKLVLLRDAGKAAVGMQAGRRGDSPPQAISNLDIGPLSNRELDVLAMLADRLSNKEIAQRLFISPETAKKHAANIYYKLGVHGRRAAVIAGRKLGLQC